ncbi:MAG: hypothetical protein ABMA25_28105, partial [Ilumatobacteraceae bacterium]
MSVLRLTYWAPLVGWTLFVSIEIGGFALASAVGQSHTIRYGRSARACEVAANAGYLALAN